jgi:hypothetical protein
MELPYIGRQDLWLPAGGQAKRPPDGSGGLRIGEGGAAAQSSGILIQPWRMA